MTKLSPHFTVEELTVSATAKRLGIPNVPPPATLERLRLCAWMMENVRRILDDYACEVTSGWRSQRVNKAVGGSDTSDHMSGWCVDFRSKFGTPFQIVARLEQSGIAFDQLINEQEKGIVHISFAPTLRNQVLTQVGSSFIGGNHER